MTEMAPSLRFNSFVSNYFTNQLEDNLDLITYGFTNPMPTVDDGEYFLITARDLKDNKINYHTARKTTKDAYNNLLSDKSRPLKGDILLSKDGTLGRVAVVDRSNICVNQSVAVLRTSLDVNQDYLLHILSSPKYQKIMLSNAGGSSIKHIYITVVNKMKIRIPSVEEQQKIASFLSSVDEKISQLEKKKTLLETYKRGIMQKIFSQELRFKDENGEEFAEWEKLSIGDVCKLQGGYAFKSEKFDLTGIPIIRISNLGSNKKLDTENLVYYDKIDNDDNFIVRKNDLLIAMSGATTGKSAVCDFDDVAYLNQRVGLFRSKGGKLFYPFLVQFVFSVFFERQLKPFLVSGAQPNISSKDIECIKIKIPEIREQQKIASFLSSIDKKIEITSTQLEKTREFKKGLLQQMFV